MNSKKFSRRQFLGQCAAVTATAATAGLLTPGLSAKNHTSETAAAKKTRKICPGEKVNLACVGIGNRGAEIIKELHNTGFADIVALCDVDMGAPHTGEIARMFPQAARFQDFRVMFDKMGGRIDAVSVGTPDHSHFAICMLAMSLGKHVYVEKPLARTFGECELLMDAEKKYGVVTQMGNQGHSEANYFQFKAWKDAGIIKDVTRIDAHMNNPRRWHSWNTQMTDFPPGQTVPATMDWDLWSMAQRVHPFNQDYVEGQWRCWYDFGMGALGDWGAHIIDTCHEFLELGLPYEINPVRLEGYNRFFFPKASTIRYRFGPRGDMPPVELIWYDGVDNLPDIPAGYGESEMDPNIPPSNFGTVTKTTLNPGKIIYSKDLIFKGASHGSTLSIIPEEKAREMAPRLPEVPESPSNHFANFLLSCKGEEKPRSPFSVSAPLSQVFCLGVIAQLTGEKLMFDPVKKEITNSTLGQSLLWGARPRKAWEEYYSL